MTGNCPPATPSITEPITDGRIVNPADVHMETAGFSDPNPGDIHACTDWEIWTISPAARVWASSCNSNGSHKVHIHLGDGFFENSHAGRSDLMFDTDYRLLVRHKDSSGDTATEWSSWAERPFRTSSAPAGGGPIAWSLKQPGYQVEVVATGFQLPVNIAFVPSPGDQPTDPYFYVTELYGTIKVVTRDGTVSDYATDLLNFNPTGNFPGSGEQGLTGIVVDPASGDLFASMLYEAADGIHYPKVVRFHSHAGGLTAESQTTILDMVGAYMAESHQISHLSIGPDGKLYVHLGDGFDEETAQDLNRFQGKILRVNLDGSPAVDNPFYDASDGLNAKDYVYAYGFRNPFGGAWRAFDNSHYSVENGPNTDRFAKIIAGRNYLWDGTDASMTNFAIYNWPIPVAPVNIAFIQPETFNGSGFPADKMGRAFVSESGPTWATGPQIYGKRISEFVLDADGNLVSGPTPLVEYSGTGKATVAALAAGPDGLYFSDLYKDLDYVSAIDRGANILRIKPSCVLPPDGMIGWYPGDGNANSLTGMNNGALQNGAHFAAGKVSQAFNFDGADDSVTLPVTAFHNAFSALTVDAWVYPISHGKDSRYGGIFGRNIVSNTESDGFALRIKDGFIQADLRLTGGNLLQTFTQAQLPLNAWSHVALVYDGSQVRVYLNGQLVGNVFASGTIKNGINASTCVMIGNEPINCDVQSGGLGWHGLIDELEVFSRALTQSEIHSIYNSGSLGKCKGGQVQFSSNVYSINENSGAATITVTRTGISSNAVTVKYMTSNGGASSPADYTATSGTLNFASAVTSQSFTIPINDDNVFESDETIHLTLSNPTGGASLGSQSTAVLTIIGDDPLPSLSVNDVFISEPTSGTLNANFTVGLSNASTQRVMVDFATADGTAAAGSDYQSASDTLSFSPGEMTKTISIVINGDTLDESSETFFVTLTNVINATITKPQAVATITTPVSSGEVLISEFRSRGPNGELDGYIELYNSTDSPITVGTSDGSSGWAVAASGGTPIFIVPNGTVIPEYGHYLAANSQYSLGSLTAPDITYTTDLTDSAGIALFRTANGARFDMNTRLDAAGYASESNTLYRNGNGLEPAGGVTVNHEFSFARKVQLSTGTLINTNDNQKDFVLVAVDGNVTLQTAMLGAPGPENLASPMRSSGIITSLIDPTLPSTFAPNHARIPCAQAGPSAGTPTCDQSNQDVAPLGFLSIRRKFINGTGAPVTRLRFRIVDITNPTNREGLTGPADLRAISSPASVTVSTGLGPIEIKGTALEAPTQNMGGGVNSTLSAGVITLSSPLAQGEEINLQFLMGVRALGQFRFFINIEALP